MSTAEKKTVWFGMKLTPEQKEKIRRLARRRGVSQKQAVLDLIEREVEQEQVKLVPGSFYDRNKDLIGTAEGPEDLSVNPDHMEGYGR